MGKRFFFRSSVARVVAGLACLPPSWERLPVALVRSQLRAEAGGPHEPVFNLGSISLSEGKVLHYSGIEGNVLIAVFRESILKKYIVQYI